ncbi:hypothetical protein [Latilactobacillus curvatus]|uniref:hypothetical protein n=1 Tax=Latilactobacillus curvatus TaxID=28038 RepID=UPI000FECE186|nr:hypothetical protein [Latilactobacillus curvatus]QAR34851.1 hypothetical protein EQK21_01765 [Latilactobacillus curvatus]
MKKWIVIMVLSMWAAVLLATSCDVVFAQNTITLDEIKATHAKKSNRHSTKRKHRTRSEFKHFKARRVRRAHGIWRLNGLMNRWLGISRIRHYI